MRCRMRIALIAWTSWRCGVRRGSLLVVDPLMFWVPPGAVGSAGDEAVDLAMVAALELDDWQQFVLRHALAERAGHRWAAFEVGLVVPRQNGKGGILEARELTGLFLLGETIIHSAHEFPTSLEAFRRLLGLIEQTPELEQRVLRVSRSHGEEGIDLRGGARIRFRTRTKGGGRGFSADLVILDEAMILPTEVMGALMPTLSARPNPQLWYTGSAVDQRVHHSGFVFSAVRNRGWAGGDESLAFFEWSVDPRTQEMIDAGVRADPSMVTSEVAADEDGWLRANPSMEVGRVTVGHVRNEHRSMDRRTFAVERLGVGDWPDPDPDAGSVIDMVVWDGLVDDLVVMPERMVFAFDVSPDRRSAAVVAAAVLGDGRVMVEVVDHRSGAGWVVDRVNELASGHGPMAVVCDGRGQAHGFAHDTGAVVVDTSEHVMACGQFFDLSSDGRLVHRGDPVLREAVRGAKTRPLGDAWAWTRRSSMVDITTLVAATLAVRAAVTVHESTYESKGLVLVS